MKATRHNVKGTAAPRKIWGGGTKNRLLSLFVALSFFISLIPVFSLPAYAATSLTGQGTVDEPYLITSASELAAFRTELNNANVFSNYGSGKYFKLTTDIINLGSWTPIANFRGNFDGRNHTISGITVNVTGPYVGFFNYITNATIKNLHLEGKITASNPSDTVHIGGIAASSTTSTITNCSFDGTINASSGSSSYNGGLVSIAPGSTFTNCWTAGEIISIKKNTDTGFSDEGPFAAQSGKSGTLTVTKCYSSMKGSACSDRGSSSFAAYIQDGANQSVYTDCYSTGTGYTRAFTGAIQSGRKIKLERCHVYNTEYKAIKHTNSSSNANGTLTFNNVYQLWSENTTTSNPTVNRKIKSIFANADGASASSNKFTNWNFTTTWRMGTDDNGNKYPMLRQSRVDTAKSRSHTYYDSSDNELFLPDYFDLILSEDKNYNQENRFTFTIPSPAQVTPKVWYSSAHEFVDGTTDDIATISGDKLVLKPDAPVGDYTITVHAHDTNTTAPYDDFDMTFTVKKKERIPAPVILTPYQPYSSMQTLSDIDITDGWWWDNPLQVPKNNDAGLLISSYDAFYTLDSRDATVANDYDTYYDYSLVTGAGFSITKDYTNNRVVLKLDPLVTATANSPVIIGITVEDEDTGAKIDNASVVCSCGLPDEFPTGTGPNGTDEGFTDSNGYLYAELAPGNHQLTVTASGYEQKTEAITVYSRGNTYTIKLKRAPGSFTIPEVYIDDGSDPPVNVPQNPKVVITMVEGGSASWEASVGGKSVSGAPGTQITLPPGDSSNVIVYRVSSATYRCSTNDVLYVKFVNGTPKYYKDQSCSQDADRNYLLVTVLDDPVYIVRAYEDGTSTPQRYKVTVDIKNIKATYGSFALTYNPDVFDFNGKVGTLANGDNIVLGTDAGNEISSLTTVEGMFPLTNVTWNHDRGYYAFIWHSDDDHPDKEIDAELNAVNIATFYFTLKDGYTTADAAVDWFGIVPWKDTYAAQQAINGADYPYAAQLINEKHWRVVDNENDRSSLGFGRIEKSQAIVMDENLEGFFQASVNPDLASTDEPYFFDVKVDLKYEFPIENSIIRFHVFDAEDNTDLEYATVNLFDTTPTQIDTRQTNPLGIAKFNVNTASNVNGYTFLYDVSCLGYWPVPEGSNPKPQINAPTGVVTNKDVPLEKKVYHKPVIVSPSNPSYVAFTGNADLGGEKYAYNHRNFHFRCKPAKGYRIKTYPKKANVYMIDWQGQTVFDVKTLTGQELEPDAFGIFTLDKSYLYQETLKSLDDPKYTLLQSYDTTVNNDYGAPYDRTLDPTVDGFRSYNIYIQFDEFEFEEISYRVEGVTNAGGTVEYDNKIPTTYPSGTTILPEDISTVGNDKHYKLTKTTIATDPDGTNHQTGTFKFKADAGNTIEKVYINGLRTYIYDGLTEFDYCFGDVDMDCNITVLFWDGVAGHENQDSLITLVVGEYGSVNVTSPPEGTGDTNLSITRRVYLNPTADLAFDAAGDSDYYYIDEVKKEVETGGVSSFVDITGSYKNTTAGSFTVPKVKGKNVVVYVTFKHPNAKPNTTPNLFVKSYVYQGMGVADPAGVLIYTLYDDVNINLSTTAPYSTKGVILQPFDDLTKITSTYDFPTQQLSDTYTYPSLMNNITIGSVFAEKTYSLTGMIELGQGVNLSPLACQTGATIRFMRLDSAGKERPNQIPYIFTSTTARTGATFSAQIPSDNWNVYFEKPGYVTYKITNFPMPASAGTEIFGGANNPVIPYIGATSNAKYVSLQDAANVKSGWRTGVNNTVKARADADDDGAVRVYDLNYVWSNFNKKLVEQDYQDFKANGSK